MMARPMFEKFRKAFITYFEEDVILAEFDERHRLVVFVNPYQKFDDLVLNICDNILNTVYFRQHLELQLYPFGSNDYIRISIN